jgi:hypothetical protein
VAPHLRPIKFFPSLGAFHFFTRLEKALQMGSACAPEKTPFQLLAFVPPKFFFLRSRLFLAGSPPYRDFALSTLSYGAYTAVIPL